MCRGQAFATLTLLPFLGVSCDRYLGRQTAGSAPGSGTVTLDLSDVVGFLDLKSWEVPLTDSQAKALQWARVCFARKGQQPQTLVDLGLGTRPRGAGTLQVLVHEIEETKKLKIRITFKEALSSVSGTTMVPFPFRLEGGPAAFDMGLKEMDLGRPRVLMATGVNECSSVLDDPKNEEQLYLVLQGG